MMKNSSEDEFRHSQMRVITKEFLTRAMFKEGSRNFWQWKYHLDINNKLISNPSFVAQYDLTWRFWDAKVLNQPSQKVKFTKTKLSKIFSTIVQQAKPTLVNSEHQINVNLAHSTVQKPPDQPSLAIFSRLDPPRAGPVYCLLALFPSHSRSQY